MKTIKLAVLISAILHVIYFVATFGIGFIRTFNYEPDIISEADNVVVLQDAVVVGTTWSPLYFMFTFIGVALLSGLVLELRHRKKIQKGNPGSA